MARQFTTPVIAPALMLPVRSVSASTTAVAGETLRCSAAGGAVVVTPPSAPAAGTQVTFTKTDISANTVTWNGTVSGDTGGVVLYTVGATATVSYDGTAWWVDSTSATASARGTGSGGSPAPAAAGLRTGSYDPQRTIYLPAPLAMRPLRGHLGRASTGQLVQIACVGDSRVAGLALGMSAQSWTAQLRGRLAAAGVPTAGTGIVLMYQNGTSAQYDSRLATTGTWNTTTDAAYRTGVTNGGTATFTADVAGTLAEVYYTSNSASFTVSVDGGAAQTVTPAGGGPTVAKWTSATLANTTHTITVTCTSTSGVAIIGFCVRTTSGILIHNLGMSTFTTTKVAVTGGVSIQAIVNNINPSIYGLMVGCNDLADGSSPIPPATTATNLDTILTTNNPAPAKFLVLENPFNGQEASWPPYVKVFYDKADSLNAPLLDINDRYGTGAGANADGLVNADLVHESVAGGADLARAAAALLAG